ncbi:MAG: YdcF family protein [Verrucomicrobiae bacterium]|nr:YdcF family protein [Verrucomicrobiae bacterium]
MRRLGRIAWWLLLLQLALIALGPPRAMQDWLNARDHALPADARWVVVLGAGGVPSSATLLRCYKAAELATLYPRAQFVVALPGGDNPANQSVGRMRDELVLRGIPARDVLLETQGRNTAEQARRIRELLGDAALGEPLIVVSSHYHVRRAVAQFRRAGFRAVSGVAAEEIGAEGDSGRWAWLRYGVWNNAIAWVRVTRELVAWAGVWWR